MLIAGVFRHLNPFIGKAARHTDYVIIGVVIAAISRIKSDGIASARNGLFPYPQIHLLAAVWGKDLLCFRGHEAVAVVIAIPEGCCFFRALQVFSYLAHLEK